MARLLQLARATDLRGHLADDAELDRPGHEPSALFVVAVLLADKPDRVAYELGPPVTEDLESLAVIRGTTSP